MGSTHTIVLFDVDGTLVLTGGAGRRALDHAFQEVCGRSDALEGLRLGGLTDRLIVRTGLRTIGEADEEERIDMVLERYLTHLPGLVERSETYRTMPGAHEAVAAVRGRAGFAVGLGTGNVRRGAEVKLSRGGLAAPFSFGGFGCDHEDRIELLRAGAQRGADELGQAVADCRLVVVGDTPRDVEAAHALSAECVGVGTGSYDASALREAGATFAFDDLTSEGVVDALVGSNR